MAKGPVCGMDVDEQTAAVNGGVSGQDLLLLRSRLQEGIREGAGEIRAGHTNQR
jgi:hypothetical protein